MSRRKFWQLMRLLTWPYRALRGRLWPRKHDDPQPELQRLYAKAARQGGMKIAYDRWGYAYEVKGVQCVGVEIDQTNAPKPPHDDPYIPGSTTWQGARPSKDLGKLKVA